MNALRCDIFCAVIDNFGDIGVCWRLARQLACEHGLSVRLWVDDMGTFRHLAPTLDPASAQQTLYGISICRWDEAASQADPADIVIEAFGCRLPEAYLTRMAALPRKPAWLNLEYLSAEAWVEGCHAMPSPDPQRTLTRYFFFPGFTTGTGGLLREAQLRERLKTFQAAPDAQQSFWHLTTNTVPSPAALKVSLFSYENKALPALLDVWATGSTEIFCAVPEGRILPQVRAWAETHPDTGRLSLAFPPFLPQDDYDLLLAACDLNFVRGEDSFVRAQWAGSPLVWHIYQQEEAAHRVKLGSFLARYTAELATQPAMALDRFWQAWDQENGPALNWPALLSELPALRKHALAWAEKLTLQQDLTTNLLIFSKNLLQYPAL